VASYRLQRIASRIKFLVGTILQREISDPRVGLVTVLKVEVTDDLKEASVHVSIFGKQGERSRTVRALEDARGFVQREVGRNLETRSTPRLRFLVDDSQDKVSRIEALVVEAKENSEGDMAKKPVKKDEKSAKDEKTSRSARKPSKPEKKGADRSSRAPAGKDEGKAAKKDEDEAPPKRGGKAMDGDEDTPEFAVDDMGEDEEKDYPEEFDADDEELEDEDDEDSDLDDDEEEEEEEEEGDEDY
jgi:ribosome-binding factor A